MGHHFNKTIIVHKFAELLVSYEEVSYEEFTESSRIAVFPAILKHHNDRSLSPPDEIKTIFFYIKWNGWESVYAQVSLNKKEWNEQQMRTFDVSGVQLWVCGYLETRTLKAGASQRCNGRMGLVCGHWCGWDRCHFSVQGQIPLVPGGLIHGSLWTFNHPLIISYIFIIKAAWILGFIFLFIESAFSLMVFGRYAKLEQVNASSVKQASSSHI